MELPSTTQNQLLLLEETQPHYHYHHHHHYHHHQSHGENETLVQSLSIDDGEEVVVEEEIEEEKECEPTLSDEFDDDDNKNGDDEDDDLECSGLERLKRHRVEVTGSVWIPEIWGQEELLKDWIDCSAFEASFRPNSILSAKSALVEEGRRATTTSSCLRIENRC